MKKIYMTPEMEILDAELEGILAASNISQKEENGYIGGKTPNLARQGGGFDDFDDYDEEEF